MMLGCLVLIVSGLVIGCAVPPADQTPLPTFTSQPPSPSLTPMPAPSQTPTLELIDHGMKYIVVGLFPGGTLPIYREPSIAAEIISQIPPIGKSIRTTGVEIQAGDINWLQIEYQGPSGWVDSSFLAHQEGDISNELITLAQITAGALKAADYQSLEEIVHPGLCLRFSPYPYLRDSDLTFCPGELAGLPGSTTTYTWGRFDGSGAPIELTFDNYYQRFIYDQDFFQPDIVGLNEDVSFGNAINNIPEIFPDGMIVEYHFPEIDPQYAGMDWRSLRMVFIEENGNWYLVALVHGEWTI